VIARSTFGIEVAACAEPLHDVAAASPLQGIERGKGGFQFVKDLMLLVVIKRIRLVMRSMRSVR
jgi:hypothetical protein